jgi:hypothetical protein
MVDPSIESVECRHHTGGLAENLWRKDDARSGDGAGGITVLRRAGPGMR